MTVSYSGHNFASARKFVNQLGTAGGGQSQVNWRVRVEHLYKVIANTIHIKGFVKPSA